MPEPKTRDQLRNFVPSYRAGYLSSGGPNRDLGTDADEAIVEKLEAADIQNEREAEELGRTDGFDEREAAQESD